MTRAQAIKRLGCSKTKLEAYVKEDKLEPPVKDEDGRWWYSIEGIEDLVEEDASQEASAARLLAASEKIIQQQYRHHEEMMNRENSMMESFLSATHKILSLQTDSATRALERSNKLEVELDEARETIAKAMNLNQANEVQMAEAAARQKRNDKIMESLTPHLPTTIGMMAKYLTTKLGGGQKTDATQAPTGLDPAIKELVTSIDADQAQKIMASGLFSPEQLATLFTLVDKVQTEAEAEKASKAAAELAEQATKAALGKAEAPKVETPKVEAPKVDGSKAG